MARQILGVLSGVGAMMVVLGKLRGKLALEMEEEEERVKQEQEQK
jgi:hypothetical protein